MVENADTEAMSMLIAIAAIGIVGALSSRYGADSRPGFDESSPLS
jgi:hypothetical protein